MGADAESCIVWTDVGGGGGISGLDGSRLFMNEPRDLSRAFNEASVISVVDFVTDAATDGPSSSLSSFRTTDFCVFFRFFFIVFEYRKIFYILPNEFFWRFILANSFFIEKNFINLKIFEFWVKILNSKRT